MLTRLQVFRINQTNASIPCTSCNIPLGVGAATGVQGLPNIYHPHCFCCDVCGSQLLEGVYFGLLRETLWRHRSYTYHVTEL